LADKIKCSHILVKKQSEAMAVLERLKKGESFANLARELSVDRGSGKKGGDLGLFGSGVMVKAFEDAAFKLNKGEVSQPSKNRIRISHYQESRELGNLLFILRLSANHSILSISLQ
jgi:peptidyl-prolyl cis-trans isomerase C